MTEPRAIQIADQRARKLGFPPEENEHTIREEDNAYVVEYFPKDPTRRGGGIEIWINRKTYRVIRHIYTQ